MAYEHMVASNATQGRGESTKTSSIRGSAKRFGLPLLRRLAEIEQTLSSTPERDGGPPGYTGFFPSLYCNAAPVVTDMLAFLIELNARFGGGKEMLPVRFNFMGKPAVLVTNPRHVQTVFKDTEHFSSSSDPLILERFRALLGFNLVTVDIDTWAGVRPRTSAFLNGRPLNEYGEIMRAVMEEEMLPRFHRAAEGRTPLTVFETMLEFSSKVVFRSFMRLGAKDIADDVHPALNRLFDHARRYVMEPSLPLWVPTPGNKHFLRDRDIVRDFLRPYIDSQKTLDTMLGSIVRAHTERRPIRYAAPLVAHIQSAFAGDSEPSESSDKQLSEEVARILERQDATVYDLGKSLVRAAHQWAKETKRSPSISEEKLQAKLESALCEGGDINRELVLQEMVSNLIGGSETTILLMSWALYYMTRFPEVQERLHQEASAEGSRAVPHIEVSTMKERWGYLYNVLRETLRLASPAAVFNRPVIADVNLDGYPLKKGTVIWGSQYITQRSPYIWEDPEAFKPERFDKPVPPGAFFPFTLGPRMCVGMNYAYLEGAFALATIAKHFTFECTTKNVGYDMGLTYRPDRPVTILLRKR